MKGKYPRALRGLYVVCLSKEEYLNMPALYYIREQTKNLITNILYSTSPAVVEDSIIELKWIQSLMKEQ